jgi:hypothetical protein
MSIKPPDFYLASTESYMLEEPRRCWQIKRLATAKRDDLMLVKIDPPLPGNTLGVREEEINLVIIATRHQGSSLFPITSWPVYVHVARPLISDPELRSRLGEDEFKSVAWAEIYRTEEDARLKVM